MSNASAIHTNKDRWWVITGNTNLYSQQQFPNMDLALTFHIGLILRIPRTEEQQRDDVRLLPFGRVYEMMEDAGAAVAQAHNLAGYHHDPDNVLVELYTEMDVFIPELGLHEPRPWHEHFPMKPKSWGFEELNAWGSDFTFNLAGG